MPSVESSQKQLIVVSIAFNRRAGSEPGKGYHWTVALSRLYRVHLVHAPEAQFEEDDLNLSGIQRHPTEIGVTSWSHWRGYWEYSRWCDAVLGQCRRIISEFPIVGLHHVTLGSFRLLPRYDRLGVPYSLGPLGGGEYTPGHILRDAGFPLRPRLAEMVRPALNALGAAQPGVRSVLRHARRVIATTEETANLLHFGGARDLRVRFPDVFEMTGNPSAIVEQRRAQLSEIPAELQIVWSGRGLWWKGGQVTIEFLRRLRHAQIPARLRIFSAGPCLAGLREQARRAGLEDRIVFHDPVPRQELLAAYGQSHLFVYPTMHDSSSSAIPEAYSTGLPSMTLGIGGVALAAAPGAGLNQRSPSLNDWLDAGVEMVRAWRLDPSLWLQAVECAVQRAAAFGFVKLQENVAADLAIY